MNISFPDSTTPSTQADNTQAVRTSKSTSGQFQGNTAGIQDTSSTEVSLSDISVQALAAQLANVPSVRQQQVQALQKAVENGTYNPSSQQIAAAIHEDLFGAPSNTGS
jgi:flagellar biosynthesis anti-sigma factor FlgM